MAWHEYRERVTVFDVLETKACFDSVAQWVQSHGGRIAGEVEKYPGPVVLFAANAFGYGNGYGNGGGYGDGYGDGGYGYGDE